jgi:hypothetical protein
MPPGTEQNKPQATFLPRRRFLEPSLREFLHNRAARPFLQPTLGTSFEATSQGPNDWFLPVRKRVLDGVKLMSYPEAPYSRRSQSAEAPGQVRGRPTSIT